MFLSLKEFSRFTGRDLPCHSLFPARKVDDALDKLISINIIFNST